MIDLSDFIFWLRYPPEGRGKAAATITAWSYTVKRFLAFLNGDPVAEAGVRRWIESLEDTGNGGHSIGRHLDALRAYFRFLGAEKLNVGNPAFVRKMPRWLTLEEWAKLVEVAIRPLYDPAASEHARYRALFYRAALLIYGGGGLRLSEGCSLRWDNIDPRGYLTVVGKGGTELPVPVQDEVIIALQQWQEAQEVASPWVFRGRTPDVHLARGPMQTKLREVFAQAGLKGVKVHSLRHTAGAHLRALGMDIRDIQDVLRHSSITSTDIYTHMAAEDLRKRLPKRAMGMQQRRMM